jgi:hypothetical protein
MNLLKNRLVAVATIERSRSNNNKKGGTPKLQDTAISYL